MEGNFQGDLADIVRACNFPDQFQPLDQDPTRQEGFVDPFFSSLGDPFLVDEAFEFNRDHGMLETAPFRVSSDGTQMVTDACVFMPMNTSDNQVIRSNIYHLGSPKTSSLIDTRARVEVCSSPRIPISTKKRKSQAKKVVCIPAPTAANNRQGGGEAVPSDLWAWRKYGQKPIKGSPYPRAYYRCSSSKGCSARKQVERSRTDPSMLVITYTSEHDHPWPTQRNSLAGSTRIPSKLEPRKNATVKEEKNNHHNISSSTRGDEINDHKEDCNKGLNDDILPDQLTMNRISADYDLFADLRDLELVNSGFKGELDRGIDSGSKSMLDTFNG